MPSWLLQHWEARSSLVGQRNMGTWSGQMKLCWRCGVSICACLLRSNVADTSTFCVLFTGESTFFVQRLPRSFLAVAPTVHLPARKISQKVLQFVICQDFHFSFQFQFSISFSKIFLAMSISWCQRGTFISTYVFTYRAWGRRRGWQQTGRQQQYYRLSFHLSHG